MDPVADYQLTFLTSEQGAAGLHPRRIPGTLNSDLHATDIRDSRATLVSVDSGAPFCGWLK
jgi:hypothetical protein